MLREIQTWHSLVLSGEEEIAKLLHNFIRLEHFCVAVLRNIGQQHSPQVGASFADSWADRADAHPHKMCTLGPLAFARVVTIQKQDLWMSVGWQMSGGPPSDSAMRLMCVGLVCPGSRDAVRQVCSAGWSRQPLMALGGVAESAVRAAGLARQLSPKMTVSCLGVPSPG